LGLAAQQKDHLPFEINPGGSSGFFAILNFMIAIKSAAKNQGRTRDWQGRRGTGPAFPKKNLQSKLTTTRLYIDIKLIR